MDEIGDDHHELELDAAHIPSLQHDRHSTALDLFDTLPTAKNQINRLSLN